MAKKMLIDATHAEETRVVVVDGNKVEEFDFESENKRQLAGNIYLAKVTRVEPSLQAAFVDYGGNRHGFLAFSEIHPDYYQIPVADRQALMEEERAYAEAQKAKEDEDDKPKRRSRSRSRSKAKAAEAASDDATASKDVESGQIDGMETIDLDDEEGTSPMERVAETPVEEPEDTPDDAPEAESADVSAQAATDGDDAAETADDNEEDEEDAPKRKSDASAKDDSIESVADDDDQEDIRPARKPRPRRYKIQEVIKVRQILLVQVVKEERGNKGAALTTYLSLAGRYCVLMPNTARGGGISRKITNAADRKKLKEIANEIEVPEGAGLIVRTAGAKRTKAEIKRDYEYLQRLWEQIRELTLKSIAPAKIYEEGDLIKRSIRDLYNREIDEVFVEGERGYRIAKDFMKMIMPSHAKNVKLYTESLPLFARYQVESYLAGMFNPTVQLPSGGYIVIGVTEALVAIDVNSGRATKEGSIEQTATKTNLEAADEVARQLRLRDLAGLIVIDFIDMDERKNNAAVEKRVKEKLKTDRARIQVGRISGFGLMEMSRQRLRPGMIEATTQPCQACHGTGLIRSDDNLALSILRQIEEEGTRKRSREVLVRAPVGIANFLMNQKREHIAQIEGRYGLSVRIEGDPALVSPDFSLEKFKTATRIVTASAAHVVSVDTSIMDQVDADEDEDVVTEEAPAPQGVEATRSEEGDGEGKPKRRRRRRRRSRNKSNGGENGQTGEANEASAPQDGETPAKNGADTAVETVEAPAEAEEATPEAAAEKPKPKRRSRTSKAKAEAEAAATEDATISEEVAEPAAAEEAKPAEKPKRKRASRAKKPKAEEAVAEPVEEAAAAETPEPAPEPVAPEPVAATPEPEAAPEPEPAAAAPEPVEEPAPAKPKRKGWWSLGG
ncbi:Rne/Rng family ribonuclease [Roseobacter sp.]|uniref:Rne/Rng family ribonuclease n=1 Tax=Roseobacter sp. TaxID=1907202 RepID=UPI002967542C|nr:Rne/Rng family ribonuclease [Roseobacter sp.]MDW3181707.1 Rne/Rng family ribonuclease [Roseobacter sp.]